MTSTLLLISLGLIACAMVLGLVRLVLGPTLPDRIVAFDTVAVCVVGASAVMSMGWDSPFFLELILVASCLGFFGTVAFVFYLERSPMERAHDPSQPSYTRVRSPSLERPHDPAPHTPRRP